LFFYEFGASFDAACLWATSHEVIFKYAMHERHGMAQFMGKNLAFKWAFCVATREFAVWEVPMLGIFRLRQEHKATIWEISATKTQWHGMQEDNVENRILEIWDRTVQLAVALGLERDLFHAKKISVCFGSFFICLNYVLLLDEELNIRWFPDLIHLFQEFLSIYPIFGRVDFRHC